MKFAFAVILSFGFIVACKSPDKYLTVTNDRGIETTVIDFTKVQAGNDSLVHYNLLALSKLADDIQMIRLETENNCLVDGKASYWLEDSCVIVMQRDQIMMFDREGHFLRTIATQGRAPGEFEGFQDARVKDGKIYLMDDFGRGKIFGIGENEGFSDFQGSTKDRFYNSFLPLDSGRILMAPFKCESTKNLIYIQDADGKYLQGIPCPPNQDVLSYNGRKLVSQVGQDYYYTPFLCDTVFQFIGGNLLPKWIFKVGARQEVEVNGESPRFLFLTVRTIIEQNTVNSVTNTTYSNVFYCYDKADKKLASFEKVWDDRFALVYRDIQDLNIQNGELFYWVYPASMLVEAIPQVLELEDVDKKIKENLKKWQEKISLDDNPVLLVGRLK